MRILATILLAVLSSLIFSCAAPSARALSRQRLEADIRFLADDLLKGRGTPSEELDIAALYLANQLRAAGWQPANDGSYFQPFTLKSYLPREAKYEVIINGISLKPEEYIFLPLGMDPSATPVTYDLVFSGWGIFAPERGVDDFAGIDVSGKAVVSLRGAPWELDPHAIHAYDLAVGKAIHVGVRGGGMAIYVSHEFEPAAGPPPSAEAAMLPAFAQMETAYLPVLKGKPILTFVPSLIITPAVFDRILSEVASGTYTQWQERLKTEKNVTRPLDVSIEVKIDAQPKESQTSNVMAILPGNDPQLKDEWVVLTAHYDHLGFHEVPPGEDGIYNGADDNGSGTATVLEIARRLSWGKPPKRSVMALLVSGEERGLLGSAYYSTHPLVPAEKVVANINLDMVGRSTGYVQALAPGSDDLFIQAQKIGVQRNITVEPDKQPTWRLVYFTDSYHFARLNVPYIMFFTAMHEDYHQPTDEADKIRFAELSRIVDVMSDLVAYYANGGEKPVFERPTWFLTPPE